MTTITPASKRFIRPMTRTTRDRHSERLQSAVDIAQDVCAFVAIMLFIIAVSVICLMIK